MSRTVTVDVTAQDVATGRRRQPNRCPVALALGRALPGCDAAAFNNFVGLTAGDRRRRVCLPGEAIGRIRHYDLTGEMAPFTFALEIP